MIPHGNFYIPFGTKRPVGSKVKCSNEPFISAHNIPVIKIHNVMG